MNVTTLVDTGADAVERYVYDAYGEVTIYDDDWSAVACGPCPSADRRSGKANPANINR